MTCVGGGACVVIDSRIHDSRAGPAAALGRPQFDAVYILHPIQDQTKAEIETKAAAALEEWVTRLTGAR